MAGLLMVGSAGGMVMNAAIVLPAVLLGRAVNVALAVERYRPTPAQVSLAAVSATSSVDWPRGP